MEITESTHAATSAQSKRPTIEKHSPVTGEKLDDFPISTPEEVQAAVARAREASKAWSKTTVRDRLRMLRRVKDVLHTHGEEYARRISADTGKPLIDSFQTELVTIGLCLDYAEKTAERVLSRKRVQTPIVFFPKTSYIEHFPMGVIAVISPWNFPMQLAMVPVLSALIAGNTVVLKPSEVTPITGQLIDEIFRRIGLPRGVVEVVQGDGSTGAALCECDVDKIFFTGSVATGRKVMAAAAKKPIPVELELGGKDAMIVCADANLERAARAAVWGSMVNCGQMCTSVERLFVEDAIHDRFVAMLEERFDRIRVGGPSEFADMGPLTFKGQIRTVEKHLKNALDAGARILRGGKRIERPGQFFAPTLITNVNPEMDIYREETFGPVLPVIRVKNAEEAIQLANNHQYGLNGSVWTANINRGMDLASKMECGQVMVNDLVTIVGNPALPFGGVKNSGFGRYHGPEGLLGFSHQKAIMVDRALLNVEPYWFPYRNKYEPMKRVYDGVISGNLAKAVVAFKKLIEIGLED